METFLCHFLEEKVHGGSGMCKGMKQRLVPPYICVHAAVPLSVKCIVVHAKVYPYLDSLWMVNCFQASEVSEQLLLELQCDQSELSVLYQAHPISLIW